MLDLKGNDPGLPAAVLDALSRHTRTGPLLVSSQNWRHLQPFAGAAPGILPVHSIGCLRGLRRVLAGESPAMCAIAVHERFLHREMTAALKRIAPLLFSRHVNDAERLATLLDSGVDGIITDSIELARDTVARRAVAEAMASTAPL